jgi:hypothetical protein
MKLALLLTSRQINSELALIHDTLVFARFAWPAEQFPLATSLEFVRQVRISDELMVLPQSNLESALINRQRIMEKD